MDKKYLEYNAADFACNPDFLRWRLIGDRASELFWTDFARNHPHKSDELEAAIRIVDSASMNRAPLSSEELRREQRRLGAAVRRHQMRRRVRRASAVAAGILLIAGAALFLRPAKTDVAGRIAGIVASAEERKIRLVIPGTGSVELDGEADIVYDSDGAVSVTANDGGRRHIAQTERDAAAVNRMIVPGGKRSSISLPDGSRVWINAGTTLEFPARFADGRRDIRVDGEVYIEVARDESKPFYLHTDGFTVNVLGTKFNVTAYGSDTRKAVVLVEGAVSVSLPEGEAVSMQPEDMLVLQDYKAQIAKVNTSDYTSWRDGILNFDGQPLRRVLASVSRYYDIPIEADYTGEIYISGKLFLFDDIATVLENLTMIAPVEYGAGKETITITRTK